ncbi:hypothetical protein [Calycomorphotria hydatis]|uniref:Secreted protein n=1 Tax=Calycomorphotria hydatis TaxID=2528027 RepID=A0A517TDB0_9PLAN|nr:hypothetical protein [Calycomorphotria hydatis]QDT66354.1 hypothetical protein V22_36200 [Calycomorphotria hydatis]
MKFPAVTSLVALAALPLLANHSPADEPEQPRRAPRAIEVEVERPHGKSFLSDILNNYGGQRGFNLSIPLDSGGKVDLELGKPSSPYSRGNGFRFKAVIVTDGQAGAGPQGEIVPAPQPFDDDLGTGTNAPPAIDAPPALDKSELGPTSNPPELPPNPDKELGAVTTNAPQFAEVNPTSPQPVATKRTTLKMPEETSSQTVATPVSASSSGLTEAEQAFVDLLQDCVMVGHFTIDGKDSQLPKAERYEIGEVKKLSGNQWSISSRIRYGDKDFNLPIVVDVLWAGDTPMISLSNMLIPGMGTFSARVLFDGNRYAGTWQHDQKGGHMFGKINPPTPTDIPE